MTATVAVRRTPQQRMADIVRSLGMLATARQVPLGDDTLLVYPGLLASHDLEDVMQACKELACESRREFEPAFPIVGTIIDRAEAIRTKRTSAPVFVSCGKCEGGMVFVNTNDEPFVDGMDRRDLRAKYCTCKVEWRDAKRLIRERGGRT